MLTPTQTILNPEQRASLDDWIESSKQPTTTRLSREHRLTILAYGKGCMSDGVRRAIDGLERFPEHMNGKALDRYLAIKKALDIAAESPDMPPESALGRLFHGLIWDDSRHGESDG